MIFAINIFSSTVFHNVLFVSVNLELHLYIYIYFQTLLHFDKAYILAPILVQQQVF